jgi:Sodium/calcium exchanger protein
MKPGMVSPVYHPFIITILTNPDEMNFALSHILGSTLSTALFVAPLTVIVGWFTHKHMDLNFEIFQIILVILAIVVLSNFLQDGKSNYLEGALCILVYAIIMLTAWFYPNPEGAVTLAANGTMGSMGGEGVVKGERMMF